MPRKTKPVRKEGSPVATLAYMALIIIAVILAYTYISSQGLLNPPRAPPSQGSGTPSAPVPTADEGVTTASGSVSIETPVLAKGIRWNHTDLTIFLDLSNTPPNFKSSYVEDFRQAAEALRNAAREFNFRYVNSLGAADMRVYWVDELTGETKDKIGNTQLNFSRTSRFSIINKADIQLLTTRERRVIATDDEMFNVAMHELGHAVGLDHSNDTSSIMYPQVQRTRALPTPEDIAALKELYKLPPFPDLIISAASVEKHTFERLLSTVYLLDGNVTVENTGIAGAPPSALRITVNKGASGDEAVSEELVPSLGFGTFITYTFQNLQAGHDFDLVRVIADANRTVEELSETNNIAEIQLFEK